VADSLTKLQPAKETRHMKHQTGTWRRFAKAGVIIAMGVAVAVCIPGVRWRGKLLVSKITGSSTTPWSDVAVKMVPSRWQESARRKLGHYVEWSRPLRFPLQLDSQKYLRYGIFDGSTPNLVMLDCHYSVLAEGQTPHRPHVHDEEEIIVPLVGEVDIIRAAAADSTVTRDERIGFGRLVYHSSRLPHTIRAVGPGPSGYLVLRWLAPAGDRTPADAVSAATFDMREALVREPAETEGSSRTLIFEGPTRLLRRLHAHLSFARLGKGSQPHQDPHDVVVIVLKGTVETTSGRMEAPGIIFHPAWTTHFFRSVGEQPARYLAVEFLARD
jgi:hypothetical protein